MNIFRKYNLIKKIFIPILALAIFLMPVSPNLEIKNERLTVNTKTNTTSAEDYTNLFPGSSVKWLSGSSSTAEFEVNIVGNQNDWDKTEYILVNSLLGLMSKNPNSTVLVVTENGNYVSSYDLSGEILMGSTKSWSLSGYSFSGPLTINGWRSVQNLQPGKSYAVDLYIQSDTGGDGGGINLFGSTRKNFYKFGKGDSFTTSAEGGLLNGENPTASRPEDKILSDGSFFACDRLMVGNALDLPCQLTKAMYYLVFVPISWIAGFAGQFMDFFVFYSTNSSSYKSNFVSDAWGAVRDIANIFFIIALLYIAIKTILSMGGHDSKKLIINIILIALIINFSLFVTQVVIDGSNILAKVFYNNIKVENQDESIAKKGDNGEKQISAGLVRTFNPQQVFDDAGIKKMTDNLSLFFLVLLLMSAISLYMIYMFISISLLFVARVVGLWLSMIFSPIAFASKTLPFEIPGLGFKKWLEDLFKQSFMAPIFIFFLYIVYLFSGFIASAVKDVSINTGQQPGLVPFMKVIIPMVILFGLLQQAKKLAVQYSGEIGQTISKTGAIAGLALGGIATGGAFLGRQVVGRTMAKASRGDTATQKYESGTAKGIQKYTGWMGSKLGLAKVYGKTSIDPTTGQKKVDGGIGGLLNKKQKHVNEIEHARHEIEDAKKAAGLENVHDSRLSGQDEEKIQKMFNKNKKSEIETNVRRGNDEKGNDIMIQDPNDPTKSYKGEEAYKAARRNDVVSGVRLANEPGDVDSSGELTDAGKKKVENKLNAEFNIALKDTTEKELKKTFEHFRNESRQNISMIDRGIAGSSRASYDVRNISNIKSDKRDGFFTKGTTALIAGVAAGIRMGTKSIGMHSGGVKIEGNFLKDLGNTITDSLKGMKVNVNLGGGGDHGGGHTKTSGGHGGGGHGGGGHH